MAGKKNIKIVVDYTPPEISMGYAYMMLGSQTKHPVNSGFFATNLEALIVIEAIHKSQLLSPDTEILIEHAPGQMIYTETPKPYQRRLLNLNWMHKGVPCGANVGILYTEMRKYPKGKMRLVCDSIDWV